MVRKTIQHGLTELTYDEIYIHCDARNYNIKMNKQNNSFMLFTITCVRQNQRWQQSNTNNCLKSVSLKLKRKKSETYIGVKGMSGNDVLCPATSIVGLCSVFDEELLAPVTLKAFSFSCIFSLTISHQF